jgi:hypothetical protein
MRAPFLEALTRPLADLQVLDARLDAFRHPVEVVSVAWEKVDAVERALETVSFGLAVAELLVGAEQADAEEDEP